LDFGFNYKHVFFFNPKSKIKNPKFILPFL
jgi:hypothetical protein